jgi:hypothetical protein
LGQLTFPGSGLSVITPRTPGSQPRMSNSARYDSPGKAVRRSLYAQGGAAVGIVDSARAAVGDHPTPRRGRLTSCRGARTPDRLYADLLFRPAGPAIRTAGVDRSRSLVRRPGVSTGPAEWDRRHLAPADSAPGGPGRSSGRPAPARRAHPHSDAGRVGRGAGSAGRIGPGLGGCSSPVAGTRSSRVPPGTTECRIVPVPLLVAVRDGGGPRGHRRPRDHRGRGRACLSGIRRALAKRGPVKRREQAWAGKRGKM